MFSKGRSKVKIVTPGHVSGEKGEGTGGFDGVSGCRGVQLAKDHKSDGVRGSGESVVFVVRVSVIVREGEHGDPCVVLAGNSEDSTEVGFAAVSGVSSVTHVDSCIGEKGVDDVMGKTGVPGFGGLEKNGVVAPSSTDLSAKLKSFYIRVGFSVGGRACCKVTYGADNAAKIGVGGGHGAWGLGEWVRFEIGAVVTAEHSEKGVVVRG